MAACKTLLGLLGDVPDEEVVAILGDPCDEIDVTHLDQARLQFDKHGPSLRTFCEMVSRSDDALVLAARAGNEALVRMLMAHKATTRYAQAARAALNNECRQLLQPHRASLMKRHPTQQLLSQATSKALAGAELADIVIRVEELCALDFTKTFSGQLAPPRPSLQQINSKVTNQNI